jgi:DNA-3-methyladenine glycosylase II
MFDQFTPANYHQLCDTLAQQDKDLKNIFVDHGYPPMWTRPNTFESLIHIILEQQVSLASALATLNKLRERLTEITPEGLLLLSDEELKACYFSRQKTTYARHLAQAIVTGTLDLAALETLSDEEIRNNLTQLKGVGNWTIDVYLMFVLQRTDLFPIGDLAAVNALKQLKKLPAHTTREDLLAIAETWKPYRTVATMLLWHYYLSIKKKK